jgi:hypothetical protein
VGADRYRFAGCTNYPLDIYVTTMSDWEPLVHIGAVRGPMELIGGDSSSPTIGLVTRYEYTHTAVTGSASVYGVNEHMLLLTAVASLR